VILFLGKKLGLILGCLMVVLGLVGCDFSTVVESDAPESEREDTDRINRFWFEYKWNPEPGFRLWERDDDGIWTEIYPSGFRSTFGGKKRMTVRGVSGDFVVKYKGEEGVTGTENGDFGVFVPDFDGKQRPIYFVHRQNGRWVPEKSDLIMNVLELRDGTELSTFPYDVPQRLEGVEVNNDF